MLCRPCIHLSDYGYPSLDWCYIGKKNLGYFHIFVALVFLMLIVDVILLVHGHVSKVGKKNH